MNDFPLIKWNEGGKEQSARWRSESALPAPQRVQLADDRISADEAYHLACAGTALLWRGDYQNARLLLQAMARRVDRKKRSKPSPTTLRENFNLYRLGQAQRARVLGMLLLPFNADHSIPLRRAPEVSAACMQVYGSASEPYVASLRELQGIIGAFEWRKNGVEVPVLQAKIYPHYGVFAPVRGEYIALVEQAPLDQFALDGMTAFDIGTGTGVLAAVLARRGISHIIATDQDKRALDCACENVERLGYSEKIEVQQADLFPEGRANLVVCNPPWLPGKPGSALEHAIYDRDSRMLRGFLNGLAAHLQPGGEGWLIISDLAEHLGLRTREELLALFEQAGLQVCGKLDARPQHPRASDSQDVLHTARAAEITSLWRLRLS